MECGFWGVEDKMFQATSPPNALFPSSGKPLHDSGILLLSLTTRRMFMTKDPVCKMDVDEKQTNFHSEYAGRKYNFCSEECKDTFDSQPERYATSAA